ncbi:MAG TPA: helix-turn-helix domain-containing protein [Anaerolineae bacterium]|jgi:DNA-binding HxlR family transcriptional regulator|nr:helix-turn-helix domain-containing protein [Anaerolineae bacterium]
MEKRPTDHSKCKRILKLIGDYWTLNVLMELRKGELRFSELQRALEGISPVTLTNRLKKLDEEELINRTTQSRDKQSVVYALNNCGRKLVPILDAIEKVSLEAMENER